MRRAFTLIELLVVISVILALLAMGFAGFRGSLSSARAGNTQTVVNVVASAISGDGRRSLVVRQAPAIPASDPLVMPNWDLNRDGWLDGDPSMDPRVPKQPSVAEFTPLDRARAAQAKYRGLLFAASNLALPKGHQDSDGHVLDAWGRPLRISAASATYPFSGSWFGVWSIGPDGIDGIANADGGDDIRSWSTTP